MPDNKLILASASPRRLELMQQVGLFPRVSPADIDESLRLSEHAAEYVLRMAEEKAARVARHEPVDGVVIGADTSVVVDDQVLGKPDDQRHAADMLAKLSARQHQVLSAVCVISAGKVASHLSVTQVYFRAVDEREMAAYWRTGEPLGKAGGYAIQGLGATFIERIEGSYSGVMGLPLFETCELLRQAGVSIPGTATN